MGIVRGQGCTDKAVAGGVTYRRASQQGTFGPDVCIIAGNQTYVHVNEERCTSLLRPELSLVVPFSLQGVRRRGSDKASGLHWLNQAGRYAHRPLFCSSGRASHLSGLPRRSLSMQDYPAMLTPWHGGFGAASSSVRSRTYSPAHPRHLSGFDPGRLLP